MDKRRRPRDRNDRHHSRCEQLRLVPSGTRNCVRPSRHGLRRNVERIGSARRNGRTPGRRPPGRCFVQHRRRSDHQLRSHGHRRYLVNRPSPDAHDGRTAARLRRGKAHSRDIHCHDRRFDEQVGQICVGHGTHRSSRLFLEHLAPRRCVRRPADGTLILGGAEPCFTTASGYLEEHA